MIPLLRNVQNRQIYTQKLDLWLPRVGGKETWLLMGLRLLYGVPHDLKLDYIGGYKTLKRRT